MVLFNKPLLILRTVSFLEVFWSTIQLIISTGFIEVTWLGDVVHINSMIRSLDKLEWKYL